MNRLKLLALALVLAAPLSAQTRAVRTSDKKRGWPEPGDNKRKR